MQVMLPHWSGRLLCGLTQLVLAPLGLDTWDPDYAVFGYPFLDEYLPPLRGLRHLAFHGMQDVGYQFMDRVCDAAKGLPQLISLHMVQPLICHFPALSCALGRAYPKGRFKARSSPCARLAQCHQQ